MNTSYQRTRFFSTIALIFLLSGVLHAQFNEAGMLVSSSVYRGDLAKTIEPTEMNACFGIRLRRNFSPRWAGSVQLTRGVLSGADRNSISETQRLRNLSFRTEYIEVHTAAELHLSKLDILDGKNSAPFISVGIGGMYFNPQAAYRGMYHDLQPLATEGKKYAKFAVQAPVGLGFKWAFSSRFILQGQVLSHFTFTDYLDDVSEKYADLDLQRAQNPTAAHLAFRTPELSTDANFVNPVGTQRGDNRKFDRFSTINLGVFFVLNDKYDLEWNDKFRIYDAPKPSEVKSKRKHFRLFKRKKTMKGLF
jgi:Domain of unknown function (DUF6089)